MTKLAISIDDIRAAAKRIGSLALRTPLLENAALNERLSARVLIKPEVLQRTGSFKFRGAYNKISGLSENERKRGVVAFSSGNHAQGVSAAARMFGINAVIVMPADAPQIKMDNVRADGATVITFDRFKEDRMALVRPYLEAGRILVPPYDDPAIIAGQGTLGLELAEQAAELGASLDLVATPTGGGGLIAGVSTAIKALSPATEIWGAEPEHFDDMRRSLEADKIIANEPGHRSICDAILTVQPGELTFPINRQTLAGAVAVSEAQVAAAMREAASAFRLVVEPGGAAAFAALLAGKFDIKGKTVAIVLSGGNADPKLYAEIIAGKI